MRLYRTALLGAALALPAALLAAPQPAHAQNDILGGVQALLGGGNQNSQNAYEQGRRDQALRDERARERWREEHAYNNGRDRYDRDYDRGYNGPDQRAYRNDQYQYGYNNGPYYDRR